MSITTTTTLQAFFSGIASTIATALAYSTNRVFVVDRLRLQDSAVPNIQIQPVGMSAVGDQSGLNVCAVDYKVHAVVKVERDFAQRATESLVGARSAFFVANIAANALRLYTPAGSGASNQVFMRLEIGEHNESEGLTSACATMRSFVRLNDDG